jgi:hypothetical protein
MRISILLHSSSSIVVVVVVGRITDKYTRMSPPTDTPIATTEIIATLAQQFCSLHEKKQKKSKGENEQHQTSPGGLTLITSDSDSPHLLISQSVLLSLGFSALHI